MYFRKPFQFRALGGAVREGFLLRAEDAAGRVSYGEVAPLPSFGTETLDEAKRVLDSMQGVIDVAQVPSGCPATRFGLSSMQYFLEHVDAGGPESFRLAALLPSGREAIDMIQAKRQFGFERFKWKMGMLPYEEEEAILDALLEHLPDGASLRLDANGTLTPELFERWLERLARAPVEFFEQPLGAEYLDLMLEAAQSTSVLLALDESATTVEQCRALADRGWVGILVIKPSIVGDFQAFLTWRRGFQGECVYSSAFETPVGMQAALALASLDSRFGERPVGFDTYDFLMPFEGLDVVSGATMKPLQQEQLEAVWKQV
ncbi:MAG: o-succinylbenzoate synthase [Opitutales bacterium]